MKLNRIFLVIAAIVIGTMFLSTVEALSVALTSPTDGSFTNDVTPDFTFQITDFTDNVTCDLLINGSNWKRLQFFLFRLCSFMAISIIS